MSRMNVREYVQDVLVVAERQKLSLTLGLRAKLVPVYWRRWCVRCVLGECRYISWGEANEGQCFRHVEFTPQALFLAGAVDACSTEDLQRPGGFLVLEWSF